MNVSAKFCGLFVIQEHLLLIPRVTPSQHLFLLVSMMMGLRSVLLLLHSGQG